MSNHTAFQKVYWREVMAETSGMTAMEFGAYVALCAAYWSNGKPLAQDQARLARTARCTDAEWASIRRVVMEFFRPTDGVFRHDKLDAALEEARIAHEKRVNSGKTGGETKASNAKAMLPQKASNALPTRTRTRTNNNPPNPQAGKEPDGFAEWWAAFGKVGSRKDAAEAYGSALKRTAVNPSTLLASAKAYHSMILKRPKSEHRFHKHGQGWLNGDMWEGQVIAPTPKPDTRYNPTPHVPLPEVHFND